MTVQAISMTNFRKESRDLLGRLKEKPLVLTQRSHPVAVLIDYDQYVAQEEKAQQMEVTLDDLILSQATRTAREFVSLEDLFTGDPSLWEGNPLKTRVHRVVNQL